MDIEIKLPPFDDIDDDGNYIGNTPEFIKNTTKTEATTVTGCKTCKKGMSTSQWGILLLGLYMLASSIYGTYHIVKQIITLF